MQKAAEAFRTISEVADDLDVPKHVLRFWEARFTQLKPMKRGGGRRYYRPEDLDLLRGIRHLLYERGLTIKGAQRLLRDEGVEWVKACWRTADPAPRVSAPHEVLERPAPAPQKSVGRRSVATSERRPMSRQEISALKRAVDELQACHDLLTQTAPPVPAKQRQSARSRR